MTTYRPATSDDAAAMAAINIAGWRASYEGLVDPDFLASLDVEEWTNNWKKWFATEDVAAHLALDENDKPCGFVTYGKLRTPVPGMSPIRPLYTAEIYAIYILPDYWRQGIGRALIRCAVEDLRTRRHRSLCLWVLKKNHRALSFYKTLGGQRCGKKKTEIGGRTLDEVCFGWRDSTSLL